MVLEERQNRTTVTREKDLTKRERGGKKE